MKEYLEEVGMEVKTVRDLGYPNAKDVRVREYAKANDMILVTQDKRSADIAERNGVKNIVITLGDISTLVVNELQKKYSSMPMT